MSAFYGHKVVDILLDGGATSNFIEYNECKRLNLTISPSTQTAVQADGITPLVILGEVHCIFTRGDLKLYLDALVTDTLSNCVILGGTTFLKQNKIKQDIDGGKMTIQEKHVVLETSKLCPPSPDSSTKPQLVNIKSVSTLLPNSSLEVTIPDSFPENCHCIIEP